MTGNSKAIVSWVAIIISNNAYNEEDEACPDSTCTSPLTGHLARERGDVLRNRLQRHTLELSLGHEPEQWTLASILRVQHVLSLCDDRIALGPCDHAAVAPSCMFLRKPTISSHRTVSFKLSLQQMVHPPAPMPIQVCLSEALYSQSLETED